MIVILLLMLRWLKVLLLWLLVVGFWETDDRIVSFTHRRCSRTDSFAVVVGRRLLLFLRVLVPFGDGWVSKIP